MATLPVKDHREYGGASAASLAIDSGQATPLLECCWPAHHLLVLTARLLFAPLHLSLKYLRFNLSS